MDHTRPPSVIGVGIDGSAESAHALGWALRLAGALGGRVVVTHGTGMLESAGLQRGIDVQGTVASAVSTAVASGELDADHFAARPHCEVRPGHPVDVLLTVAAEEGVDLLVVGRRGIGRNRAGLGSTSEALLQSSPVPVVVFPPGV
jgi:nucleotide-binding universal stress UspA family protein